MTGAGNHKEACSLQAGSEDDCQVGKKPTYRRQSSKASSTETGESLDYSEQSRREEVSVWGLCSPWEASPSQEIVILEKEVSEGEC